MSKHLKKKMTRSPKTCRPRVPWTRLLEPWLVWSSPPLSPHADDGCQRVAEQLDSLHPVLLQMVTLVRSSAVTDRPRDVSPRGDEQKPLQGISEGPPWKLTTVIVAAGGLSAITHAVDTTRQEATILGAAVEMRSEPAISVEPHGRPPCGVVAAQGAGVGRSHRLPHIKEFVAVCGDWSAFTWRFESAFRSVRWTEEEALGVLPTVLDDQALAVFHSISRDKKKTLKDEYAEMAEVYEPPLDTQLKFMPRKHGSNESLLAYNGTLLALAVAAYPNAKPEMLDPLILGKMLELAKDMGVSLPVCGHEPLTARVTGTWQPPFLVGTHGGGLSHVAGGPTVRAGVKRGLLGGSYKPMGCTEL